MPPVPLHAYYGVGHPEERESELETISSDDVVTPIVLLKKVTLEKWS